jgi:hypothetical protein
MPFGIYRFEVCTHYRLRKKYLSLSKISLAKFHARLFDIYW